MHDDLNQPTGAIRRLHHAGGAASTGGGRSGRLGPRRRTHRGVERSRCRRSEEHRAACDHRNAAGGPDPDLDDGHVDRCRPDHVCRPVAALRRRGRELRRPVVRAQPDADTRLRRCEPHDAHRHHGDRRDGQRSRHVVADGDRRAGAGGRSYQHDAADDLGHRQRRSDRDCGPRNMGGRADDHLRLRLAALRRERRQVRADRERERPDLHGCRQGRRRHAACGGDGHEPAGDRLGDVGSDRPSPRVARGDHDAAGRWEVGQGGGHHAAQPARDRRRDLHAVAAE